MVGSSERGFRPVGQTSKVHTKVQKNEQQIHTKFVRGFWCHGLASPCFPPGHQKGAPLWCQLWCTGEKSAPQFCCTRLVCSLVSFGVKMHDFWCGAPIPEVSPLHERRRRPQRRTSAHDNIAAAWGGVSGVALRATPDQFGCIEFNSR